VPRADQKASGGAGIQLETLALKLEAFEGESAKTDFSHWLPALRMIFLTLVKDSFPRRVIMPVQEGKLVGLAMTRDHKVLRRLGPIFRLGDGRSYLRENRCEAATTHRQRNPSTSGKETHGQV
jgi:hypothetical protein